MLVKVRPAFSFELEDERRKKNLQWSWKPILMGMRILGVDLAGSTVSLANRRWFKVYGLFCFVFTVFCNGTNCYYVAKAIIQVTGANSHYNVTSTMLWSVAIDNANVSLHGIGIHLTILLISHSDWKELWQTFKQVARRFDLKFYERLRKCSSGAVLAITSIELFLLGSSTVYCAMSGTFFNSNIFVLISALSEIFRISGTVLFVLCALSASTMFSCLRSDIETHRRAKTPREMAFFINKWKRTHALACLFVDWINRCFGFLLLLDSTCIFLRIIMSAFQAFMEFREKKVSRLSVLQSMHTIELFFQFWIMCIVAGNLQMKASHIILAIRKLELTFPYSRRLVEILFNQVNHSPTTISALGLFEINQQLVPKLIATTLSYLIILNQFRLQET